MACRLSENEDIKSTRMHAMDPGLAPLHLKRTRRIWLHIPRSSLQLAAGQGSALKFRYFLRYRAETLRLTDFRRHDEQVAIYTYPDDRAPACTTLPTGLVLGAISACCSPLVLVPQATTVSFRRYIYYSQRRSTCFSYLHPSLLLSAFTTPWIGLLRKAISLVML